MRKLFLALFLAIAVVSTASASVVNAAPEMGAGQAAAAAVLTIASFHPLDHGLPAPLAETAAVLAIASFHPLDPGLPVLPAGTAAVLATASFRPLDPGLPVLPAGTAAVLATASFHHLDHGLPAPLAETAAVLAIASFHHLDHGLPAPLAGDSGGSGDCVIPPSGPWPPCATGGNSGGGSGDCVIPPSGPWPPCATGGNGGGSGGGGSSDGGDVNPDTLSVEAFVARCGVLEYDLQVFTQQDVENLAAGAGISMEEAYDFLVMVEVVEIPGAQGPTKAWDSTCWAFLRLSCAMRRSRWAVC